MKELQRHPSGRELRVSTEVLVLLHDTRILLWLSNLYGPTAAFDRSLVQGGKSEAV